MTDTTSRPLHADEVDAVAVADRIYGMFALVDRREGRRTVEYCADEFVMTAVGLEFDRAQYEQLMAGREQAPYDTRHLVHNVRVVERDADSVTVRYIGTVHRLDRGDELATVSVVDGEDRWVVRDGQLRLARRELVPVFDGRPVDKRGL